MTSDGKTLEACKGGERVEPSWGIRGDHAQLATLGAAVLGSLAHFRRFGDAGICMRHLDERAKQLGLSYGPVAVLGVALLAEHAVAEEEQGECTNREERAEP